MEYRHSSGITPQYSPKVSPGESNPYPQQVLKLIPCRVRTSLPSFIQSYSSQGLITGLSSAICPGRSPSAQFFHSPAGVYLWYSPAGVYLWYSPAQFIFGVPRRSLSSLSPAESIIEVLSRPLIKTSAKYLGHGATPRPIIKDLFS